MVGNVAQPGSFQKRDNLLANSFLRAKTVFFSCDKEKLGDMLLWDNNKKNKKYIIFKGDFGFLGILFQGHILVCKIRSKRVTIG